METNKTDREEQRKMLREHSVQVENMIFSALVKMSDERVVADNATAVAALTHALVEIQKSIA